MLVSWRVLPFGVLPWHFAGIHRPFNGCRKLPTVTHPKLPTFSTFIFPQEFLRNPWFERGYEYIYIYTLQYLYIHEHHICHMYSMYHIYIYHMYMTIWLSPFFKKEHHIKHHHPYFLNLPDEQFLLGILFPGCFSRGSRLETRGLDLLTSSQCSYAFEWRCCWKFGSSRTSRWPMAIHLSFGTADLWSGTTAPEPRRDVTWMRAFVEKTHGWNKWWRWMGRWGGLLDIYLFTMTLILV